MNRLLSGKFHTAVEKAVSDYTGERFTIRNVVENRVGAMHDAAFSARTIRGRIHGANFTENAAYTIR